MKARHLFALAAALTVAASPAPPACAGRLIPREYRLRAALDGKQIDGTIDLTFANDSRETLHELVFVLFPNRFAQPDDGVNDFNRAFIYPEQDFDPGRMDIIDASVDGTPTHGEPLSDPRVADGVLLRIPIPALPPAESTQVTLRFRTVVPHRFGSFGEFERQLTLIGGWYPYLAALAADGRWQLDASPPLATFAVELTASPDSEVVLNGRHFDRGQPVAAQFDHVHYLALVTAPEFLRNETTVDGTHIVLLHRPPRRSIQHTLGPSVANIMIDTLRDIVALRPAVLPPPPPELVVVEAPLRLNLTAQGEGAVIVSDRALRLYELLRPFHELQLAQAVYGELLRPLFAAREPAADYAWVGEGESRVLADRYIKRAYPDARSVQDWIELFNVFAIVDRFESVPKIPFVDAFFERAPLADPLHSEIATFNSRRPPGHVILGKLREAVGDNTFAALVDRCLQAPTPFRRCAGAGEVIDQWLLPYPKLNYRFDQVALNQPAANGYHHTVTVRREASRPIIEPVTVRLRSIGGREVNLRWNGEGDVAVLSSDTPARMWQAIIDPDRKLIEDRRDDDARPPTPQVVLDTAEVEISSTEFGISGLVVGRGRYDYRKDIALAGFYTNRSIGLTAGGRWHWGTPIDATLYRHNLYAFYGLQSLTSGFTDARRPTFRTPGQLASLGLRYDYTNVFAYDNPTDERSLRLYADWYDRGLGGDFNYVDWGYRLVGTHPLWGYRLIGAAELLNGFSEPLGSSVVPNQGLYSLGGSRSIRGIGAEDELGRNLLVVRAELRHDIYPEVDLNLLNLLVVRRGQVRLFADSGDVGNSAGRVYDVGRFAVGVGVGLAAAYEFLGFFPSVAYLEVATRVDDTSKSGDVQFLFGTRQAF